MEKNTKFTAAMTFNADKVAIQDLRDACKLGEKEMMRVILQVVTNHQAELETAAAQYIIDEQTAIETAKQAAKAQKDADKAAVKELRDAERATAKALREQERMQKAAQKAADKANKQIAKAAALAEKVTDLTTETETEAEAIAA
jgi:peptidoglycan hydrolase CwlO-like protein